jgi:hypothetical protein
MRIKKHQSGNEYVLAGGVWVRNFTNDCLKKLQISEMFYKDDYSIILKNEELNKNYPKISDEKILFDNVVIVSDGYDFERRHLFLGKLPKKTAVLAVNRVVGKWGLLSSNVPPEQRRTINAYVVNNPYNECLEYLPGAKTQYYPTCLASIRTNHQFLKKYKGDVYTYISTPEERFGLDLKEKYYIDDYRNPICAAIGLAFRFRAKKVMLVCCDDSTKIKRDNAVLLENGLYTYPQHIKSHEIIDANLYWLSHEEGREVKVANYSSGPKSSYATYIDSEEGALNFFMEHTEGTSNV